jgi:hypothetical protein
VFFWHSTAESEKPSEMDLMKKLVMSGSCLYKPSSRQEITEKNPLNIWITASNELSFGGKTVPTSAGRGAASVGIS